MRFPPLLHGRSQLAQKKTRIEKTSKTKTHQQKPTVQTTSGEISLEPLPEKLLKFQQNVKKNHGNCHTQNHPCMVYLPTFSYCNLYGLVFMQVKYTNPMDAKLGTLCPPFQLLSPGYGCGSCSGVITALLRQGIHLRHGLGPGPTKILQVFMCT